MLARRSHAGPLVVQRPFHPEPGPDVDPCHVYLLHPPGGVVGGDGLAIGLQLASGTHVLATTPAAGKFYRSAGAFAQQTQTLDVGDGALEWLPQESIFYAGARVRMTTRVRLGAAGRFLGWELACLGRPASGEAFARGEVLQSCEVERAGRLLLHDRIRIDGQSPMMRAPWGLAGRDVLATFLATPVSDVQLAQARTVLDSHADGALLVGATRLDDLLLVRCVTSGAGRARRLFQALWCALRPSVFGRAAVPPRIWWT